MPSDKQRFIQLCIDHNILRFGEFTLKSGRVSPYFFNAGLFHSGYLLSELARYYGALIANKLPQPFMLYGPAYKGIPLAAATAISLANNHDLIVPYAFNRKQAKDHGEGGNIVGAELTGSVVIIDDVITAGTSVGESVDIIRDAGAMPSAVVIALDRQEVAGDEGLSTAQQIENVIGIPLHAIITLDDLVTHLMGNSAMMQYADTMMAYRDRYGSV